MADRSDIFESDTRKMYDERSMRKLRHRDASGLTSLLDDYLSLADELEGVPDACPPSKPTKRAA